VKTVADILYKVHIVAVAGSTDVVISGVQIDSRKASHRTVFVAVKGSDVDGHKFIETAIDAGAVAVVCQEMPAKTKEGVTYVRVDNSAEAAGVIAHNFYGQPSQKLKLVGVTGTNGKTTIATLLYKLFDGLGYKCGLISTVENIIDGKIIPSTHTTPDAVSLNSLLKRMVDEECAYAFMEVSSHAVHQNRIAG
jgi:UDP-N-acetylmuramoyl-L-alanyl-D-glutamate--2,6-diaminopimelate ligase